MKRIIGIITGLIIVFALQAQSFEGAMKVVERPVKKSGSEKQETPAVSPSVPKTSQPVVRIPQPESCSIRSPHPDFIVKLVSCNRMDDVAVVKFMMTNVGKDVEISFYPYEGEAFDNTGNTYPVHCRLKDRVVDYAISQLLPTNIPVSFTFQVNGIDPSANELLRLQVRCEANGKSLLKNNIMFQSLKMKK